MNKNRNDDGTTATAKRQSNGDETMMKLQLTTMALVITRLAQVVQALLLVTTIQMQQLIMDHVITSHV